MVHSPGGHDGQMPLFLQENATVCSVRQRGQTRRAKLRFKRPQPIKASSSLSTWRGRPWPYGLGGNAAGSARARDDDRQPARRARWDTRRAWAGVIGKGWTSPPSSSQFTPIRRGSIPAFARWTNRRCSWLRTTVRTSPAMACTSRSRRARAPDPGRADSRRWASGARRRVRTAAPEMAESPIGEGQDPWRSERSPIGEGRDPFGSGVSSSATLRSDPWQTSIFDPAGHSARRSNAARSPPQSRSNEKRRN